MMTGRDQIFQVSEQESDFKFDAKVVRVFDDMISRSVPYYDQVQSLIVDIAKKFYVPGTIIYDLGCSLAETSLRIASVMPSNCKIVGIDNSPYMIEAAKTKIRENGFENQIDVREGSIGDELPTESASVAIISLTLQFIRPLEREDIIRNVYRSLKPGGVLIIFEKIVLESALLNRLFIEKYHEFKSANGYTDEEISRKRLALENVLIPFTMQENVAMLKRGGFRDAHSMSQWLNFTSFIAVK